MRWGKQSEFKTSLILDENHWFLKHSRPPLNLSYLSRIIAPRVGHISRQHTKQRGRGNTPQGPQLLFLMAVFPSGLPLLWCVWMQVSRTVLGGKFHLTAWNVILKGSEAQPGSVERKGSVID